MRELEGKRPAVVVDTRQELLISGYLEKAALMKQVRSATARGEVRPIDARPLWNPDAGRWEQRVIRLRPAPAAWRRPAGIAAAAISALLVLAGLGWWLVTSLSAVALGALCVFAVAILAGMLRAGREANVTIINNNYVRVK